MKVAQGRAANLSERGQAILEYTLLLLIVLGLLFGVIYQFNSAFRNYADAYFVGEESYLACLVKNGLLPGSTEAGDICPKPQFNMASGKTLQGQGAAGGGENTQNAKQGGSQNSPAATQGGGGGNPRAARAGESRSGLIPVGSNSRGGGNANSAKGGTEKDKPQTGSDGFSTAASGQDPWSEVPSGKSGVSKRKRPPLVEEVDLSDSKKVQNIPATEKDLKATRDIAFEKNKRKKKSESEELSAISFGDIFKYLILAVLFFSIIFFLGSQFVAVARSKKRK